MTLTPQENLEDCSGCTDSRSEGTHAMHTRQHPCPEGGDPNCGECFPVQQEKESTWEAEFLRFFPLNFWATEDYHGGVDDGELQYLMWEDRQKKIALERATQVRDYIHRTRTTLIEEIEGEIEGLRNALIDRDTNFGMNESYRIALQDTLSLLNKLKEKNQ